MFLPLCFCFFTLPPGDISQSPAGEFLYHEFAPLDATEASHQLCVHIRSLFFQARNLLSLPHHHDGQNHDRNEKRYPENVFHGFSPFLHSALSIARAGMFVKR